jgi:uncharacterized membrane protein
MAADLVIARIVHILGAAVWVGGTVFIAAVAVPYARTLDEARRSELVAAIGRRFRPVAWTALAASVGSGLFTMQRFGLLRWEMLRAGEYGNGLLIKLGLVAVVLVLAALHDFVLGPRYERTGAGRSALVAIGRTNGVLTLLVLVLGVLLAH